MRQPPDAVPGQRRAAKLAEQGDLPIPGIVHIAPGCGSEDFKLGSELGLPVIAPLDENGIVVDGFGSLTGRDVRDVSEPIVEQRPLISSSTSAGRSNARLVTSTSSSDSSSRAAAASNA